MRRPAAPAERRLRTVFISDVHLGTRHCHAAELAESLGGLLDHRGEVLAELPPRLRLTALEPPRELAA